MSMKNNALQAALRFQTNMHYKILGFVDTLSLLTLEMEQNAHGFWFAFTARTNRSGTTGLTVDKIVCICEPECPMHCRGSWMLNSHSSLNVRVHAMLMHRFDGPSASHQRKTRGLLTSQHQKCGGGLEMRRETLRVPKTCVSVGLPLCFSDFSASWHACLRFLSTCYLSVWFLYSYCFSTHNIIL